MSEDRRFPLHMAKHKTGILSCCVCGSNEVVAHDWGEDQDYCLTHGAEAHRGGADIRLHDERDAIVFMRALGETEVGT